MNKPTLRHLAVCCALAAACPTAADSTHPLSGFYYGTATIAQPASFGTLDLAFSLDVTGTAFQGYIDLDRTLLFGQRETASCLVARLSASRPVEIALSNRSSTVSKPI
jgi:hypothetical protein